MDKNYAARMEYRKRLIHSEHRDNIINVNDAAIAGPAIRELYTYLLGTYLPVRYPTMFRLQYPSKKEIEFHNLVTGDSFPVQPTEHLPLITLLQSLGYTFDEDFYFLLPETTTDGSTKYVLQAYMTVAPAGFSPLEKLGKRLADIHQPVPKYAEKLQSSMDRFFASLNVGRHVRRLNWSVTVDAELFCPGGNDTHAYEGDQVEQLEHIDIDKVCVCPENNSDNLDFLDAKGYRLTCAASGRRYIDCHPPGRLSSPSRRICIPSEKSKMKGWGRTWLRRLTAFVRVMQVVCTFTNGGLFGGKLLSGICVIASRVPDMASLNCCIYWGIF